MGSLPFLLSASWSSVSVAMDETLRYVTRRLTSAISEVVCVPLNFVTDVRSGTFVPYYAVDVILLGRLVFIAFKHRQIRREAMLAGLEQCSAIPLRSVRRW